MVITGCERSLVGLFDNSGIDFETKQMILLEKEIRVEKRARGID